MERLSFRKEVKRSWWYYCIRSVNWFCYQYWWFILILFLSLLFCWHLFCFRAFCCTKIDSVNSDELNQRISSVKSALEYCCNCNTSDNGDTAAPEIGEINSRRDSLGGKTGIITITLAWNTIDDLDLHLIEPSGNVIFFRNNTSASGGKLDIDMNSGERNLSIQPIENIYFISEPPKGKYQIKVHFYQHNSNYTDIPYVVYIKTGNNELTFQRSHSKMQSFDAIYEFTY